MRMQAWQNLTRQAAKWRTSKGCRSRHKSLLIIVTAPSPPQARFTRTRPSILNQTEIWRLQETGQPHHRPLRGVPSPAGLGAVFLMHQEPSVGHRGDWQLRWSSLMFAFLSLVLFHLSAVVPQRNAALWPHSKLNAPRMCVHNIWCPGEYARLIWFLMIIFHTAWRARLDIKKRDSAPQCVRPRCRYSSSVTTSTSNKQQFF